MAIARSRDSVGQNPSVAIFHVVLRRSGPRWDPSRPLEGQSGWRAHASFMDGLADSGFVVLGGPLADEQRVVLVVEAESEDAVRARLARDPWHETHLRLDTIDHWTIRLDAGRL
ncbi:MAG: YciI family protein [Gaiella sp.]